MKIRGLKCLMGISFLMTGCGGANQSLVTTMRTGEYSEARKIVASGQSADVKSNTYILDRVRMAAVTLADGYALATDPAFGQLYSELRIHDANKGSEIAQTILWESVKRWKGEPFEQALAFHYVSVHDAMMGDWGNARAAAVGSLFQLKDFGVSAKAAPNEKEGSEQVAMIEKFQKDATLTKLKDGEEVPAGSYVARDTNFALGYLMAGVANRQLAAATGDTGRRTEASDYCAKAASVQSNLSDVARKIDSGSCNTILIVDYGQGPEKYGHGPDSAIADFRPLTKSDGRALRVTVNGQMQTFPAACDVNGMSMDHRWRGLQDVRIAKSHIGSALMVAGAGVGVYAAAAENRDAGYAAAALLILGAIEKASAHADCNYCEVIPQRVYVAPINLTSGNSTVEMQLENDPISRIVLTGLTLPKAGGPAVVKYVRLVMDSADAKNPSPAPWAISGKLFYASDDAPTAGSAKLPYILGGTCCRTPTEAVLREYQAAGFLKGMTLAQLKELYKAEGIALTPQEQQGLPGTHVLEGGKSLVSPQVGTAGFARLFGQMHKPYEPSSDAVKNLAKTILVARGPTVASK